MHMKANSKGSQGRQAPQRTSSARLLLGATMAIAGLATICGLVWIGNSHDRLAQRLMFDLGLAVTGLISAGAQVLILTGAWLMWRSWPRGGQEVHRSCEPPRDEQA